MAERVKLWAVWREGLPHHWVLDDPEVRVPPDAESDGFLLPEGFRVSRCQDGFLGVFDPEGVHREVSMDERFRPVLVGLSRDWPVLHPAPKEEEG
jgi:hypothetical protein